MHSLFVSINNSSINASIYRYLTLFKQIWIK